MPGGRNEEKSLFLKSLQLQGFKSFPDRTVLDFDRGMSAVVGPNGSGKSNIADAVRWVLGEQSNKTLRGAKMEDVVFKGTAERGPVGYAEVSLVLDNGDGTLPIEAGEVMVTRRYFRSGESEYYINREPVRLRDVHELFMDTGLGRDGYSIIGQGRIDEILSTRSTDRREIFEEAAGISKYRYRKEEAERKLDATEQNLLRINDKIAELELSVGPMREQAETAKKYLVLRDDLRVAETSVWMVTLERLRQSAQKSKSDLAIASEQLGREQSELERLYARAEELAEQMRAGDVAAETARAELSDAEQRLAAARSEVELIEGRVKNLDENIERTARELEDERVREQSRAEQIAERERRAQECEDEIARADAEIAELEKKISEMLESEGEIGEKADALAARIAGEEAELSQLRVDLGALEATDAETERRRSEAESGLEAKRAELAAAESELSEKNGELEEERGHLSELENLISGYAMRLERRRSKLGGMQEERTKLRMDLAAAQNRFKLLTDMERENEGAPRAVKMVLAEAERGGLRGVHGQLSRLISADDRSALAIETALGAALQNIVVSTEEDAKEAISYLKRRDGGRATFLPVSAIRARDFGEDPAGEKGFIGIASELVTCDAKYRNIVSNLLSRTVVVDNMDNAIAMARRHSQRFRIVTSDGQIINAGGSMTGGSAGRGTGVLSRANEISRLRTECEKLEAQLSERDKAVREAEREVAAAEYENGVAESERREASEAVIRLEGELHAIEARRDSARDAASSLESERTSAEERLKENAARAAELAEKISLHEAARDAASAELDELKEGSGELTEQRGSFSGKMAELREKRSASAAELASVRQSAEDFRRMGEQYASDVARREELIGEYGREKSELLHAAEEKRGEVEELGRERDGKSASVETLRRERMATDASRSAVDRDVQERNRAIMDLERERARLEQRTGEADMQEKQIIDRMWEAYELTPLTAAEVAKPVENLQSEQRRVSSLRREMTALGPVNIGAIDEWARLSERYEYLTSQRDDVTRSADELKNIIAEITGEMKEIFTREFARINEKFGETFAELFGGGKAAVRLEDESDVLGSGIAIDVRLPGKTTLAIGSLSGGEKAFVATALYFAILKVRPTPFCIVDEVDTALDERNVLRAAAYMKRLCESTQFIAITHKRGTMEACDALYGVTMQSPGVSKILPLSISEVERELGMELK